MKKLEFLLSKYEFKKRQIPFTLNMGEIEKLIGFKLPGDYLFFLKYYVGYENFIGNEFVRLWDADELIISNLKYDIFGSLHSIMGIGGNGGGEFIGIEKTELNLNLVLSPFLDFEKTNHIIIGNSFTDFLIRLDEKREWFGV